MIKIVLVIVILVTILIGGVFMANKSQGARIPYKNGLYSGKYDPSRTLK